MTRLKNYPMTIIAVTGLLFVSIVTVMEVTAKPNTSPSNSKAYLHAYNLPASGLALDGYCPVAYHVLNKPVKGSPEHSSIYNSVTYNFVNADAKKYFDQNPEKYLPAYGGWCAFGMAIEDKFPVDPTNFKIVDGKLMLFLRNQNVDALKLWNQNNEESQLTKANKHWEKVSQ
ncbi:hypothetical protein KS4_33520 [Poriferisphaera corsica]|uniref:YHS domain protein n=1 Tax=Poriferisphaera corsica TaxID=2528020 RepID=A0A517YYI8_9BACT|nr:YHS domain-containing (seleno)protein [Poriferisphaera corsica]QDU35271.1 hypothetical protein KS4_33520 [Poriferisphaera corsica]